MQTMFLVGAAGLAGTLARFWIVSWTDQRWGASFPAGTIAVNLMGCLIAGFLFHTFQFKYPIPDAVRAAVFAGFLGGLTTFSAYALQTFVLMRGGQFLMAGVNLIASNAIGLSFVWIGYSLSRAL